MDFGRYKGYYRYNSLYRAQILRKPFHVLRKRYSQIGPVIKGRSLADVSAIHIQDVPDSALLNQKSAAALRYTHAAVVADISIIRDLR